jgi:hypothetical protein
MNKRSTTPTWKNIKLQHGNATKIQSERNFIWMSFTNWTILFIRKMKIVQCCNLNLGLAMKVRAYKVVGQEWSLRVTFHVLGSVGESEGLNPHTPKWALTLGVGVLMDFQIFKGQLQGVKTHWIEKFIILLESSWNVWCLKWARMTHLGT